MAPEIHSLTGKVLAFLEVIVHIESAGLKIVRFTYSRILNSFLSSISLFFILFSKACGFSFPSFETGNEALEKIKEAGREIIAKASKNVEEMQETVEEKLQPTEKVKKILKDIEEKVSSQKEEWKERKKQMKEMYKELKQKAGENKDELVKMWKENKGTWRQQAEEVSYVL